MKMEDKQGLKQNIQSMIEARIIEAEDSGTIQIENEFRSLKRNINILLDEVIKQIQDKKVAITLEHTAPSPEFWKGWNKAIDRVLAVLDGRKTSNSG